jgi:hypothetical protein
VAVVLALLAMEVRAVVVIAATVLCHELLKYLAVLQPDAVLG